MAAGEFRCENGVFAIEVEGWSRLIVCGIWLRVAAGTFWTGTPWFTRMLSFPRVVLLMTVECSNALRASTVDIRRWGRSRAVKSLVETNVYCSGLRPKS